MKFSVHPLFATTACAAFAAWVAGCVTDRLDPDSPQNVDLSGEWQINWNLSDDPQKVGEDEDKETPHPAEPVSPGRHGGPGGYGRPGMGGPGGFGSPGDGPMSNNDTRQSLFSERPDGTASSDLLPVLYTQAQTSLPNTSSDSASAPAAGKLNARDKAIARMLDVPEHVTISQSGAKLTVTYSGSITEYTAGEKITVPFGLSEAERTAGWRESIFAVVFKAKKGPSKEDDFALDSEGHLIFATLLTHTHKGTIDFKRVYDRVPPPN